MPSKSDPIEPQNLVVFRFFLLIAFPMGGDTLRKIRSANSSMPMAMERWFVVILSNLLQMVTNKGMQSLE